MTNEINLREYQREAMNALTGPEIITGPGKYVTRCGDLVTIYRMNGSRWRGFYQTTGISDGWLATGRLFLWSETKNDIVGVHTDA